MHPVESDTFPFVTLMNDYKSKRGPARGGSRVACLNFKMSRVGVLSVLHVAVGNLMKIVCPCRNLRLGKTLRDAENRSRAEVLYHLRPTHAYLVKRSANNANRREKYMDEGFTTRESRHPCSIFHCLYFYWSNFSLVGLYITLKLAQKHMKSLFFVVNSRPYCHCRSFVEKSCLLSQIYFMRCRYFLGHVACRNLPWQGLANVNCTS